MSWTAASPPADMQQQQQEEDAGRAAVEETSSKARRAPRPARGSRSGSPQRPSSPQVPVGSTAAAAQGARPLIDPTTLQALLQQFGPGAAGASAVSAAPEPPASPAPGTSGLSCASRPRRACSRFSDSGGSSSSSSALVSRRSSGQRCFGRSSRTRQCRWVTWPVKERAPDLLCACLLPRRPASAPGHRGTARRPVLSPGGFYFASHSRGA